MYHPSQTFTSYFQQMQQQQPDTPSLSFQQVNLNVNAKAYESPKHQKKQKNGISMQGNICSPITLNNCSSVNTSSNNTNNNTNSNNNNSSSTINSNTSNTTMMKSTAKIIEVYEDNFIKEIKRLSKLIQAYPFIGMDTEFPGIVYPCPSPCFDFYYQFTKANIDKLKLIQIGITLFNNKGEYPQYASTWQFNIKFDQDKDEHSIDSINMLKHAGIDFDKLCSKGIPYLTFAEHLITSGLVLNENTTWISFNGLSDFAYLLNCLSNLPLPSTEEEFEEHIALYFPNIFDLKILLGHNSMFKGSLNKVASDLHIERTGETHQAGSDSMVTGNVFFALIKKGIINGERLKYCHNILFGIGEGADDNETIQYTQFANENDMRMIIMSGTLRQGSYLYGGY